MTGRIVTLFAAACALGDIARADAAPPPTNAAPALRVDRWQRHVSRSIGATVDYFDGFFGEDRMKEDNQNTRLLVRFGLRFDRRDEVAFHQDVSLRLALPRLQQSTQLFLDNLFDVDRPFDEGVMEERLNDAEPDAGLRYVLTPGRRVRINTDAGVRMGHEPQGFGRIRTRYVVPREVWELRFTGRLYWFTRDGFGEDTGMTWSRRLSDGALFRSDSVLKWTEEEASVTPRQAFVYYRAIDARTSWRTALRASWPETPHGGKSVYGEELTVRRLVHADWLFAEISAGLEWLEEDDFGWNPFVLLTFEVNFEDTGAPAP